MRFLILAGLVYVFVFILNMLWPEQNMTFKPIITGLFTGGAVYLSSKWLTSKDKSKDA
ncbi:hypothetical protein [Fictibacillus terranigra]|uniref:XapX domain-containing protein n=1 Tax=Fictibacillus terranigra TaxID=3058424 RepID=A0ABT8E865_9BACL|nr:hypothetical protein [Fictibacillus sp. CENA-BCM004]MDN4074117.1 hypothetical protein [Fictibacillus sp. CENA-BCM004]